MVTEDFASLHCAYLKVTTEPQSCGAFSTPYNGTRQNRNIPSLAIFLKVFNRMGIDYSFFQLSKGTICCSLS